MMLFIFTTFYLAVAVTSFTTITTTQATRPQTTHLAAILRFKGDFSYTSDTLPVAQKSDLVRFINKKDNQLILYNAGGKRQADYVYDNVKLDQYWKEMQAETYGLDKKCDYMLACATSSKFPGLQTQRIAASACSLVSDAQGLPQLESYCIGEMQTVKGLPPVVWIYNALTGYDKASANEYQKPKGCVSSTTRIINCDKDSIALQQECHFEIIVEFPDTLLKILPASIERMEEQGRGSVRKAIGEAIEESLQAFTDVFKVQQSNKVVV